MGGGQIISLSTSEPVFSLSKRFWEIAQQFLKLLVPDSLKRHLLREKEEAAFTLTVILTHESVNADHNQLDQNNCPRQSS